jgi:peptide deformylase
LKHDKKFCAILHSQFSIFHSFLTALPIVTGQDTPVLRAPTKRVGKVTKEILSLIKDMEDTVKKADGLGLAAPQVDQSLRLCLAKIGRKLTPLIDPEITWRGPAMDIAEEGCLSLPGIWMNVARPTEIVVRYTSPKGAQEERRLAGLDARVVQHEVDHLEGILIVDYPPIVPANTGALVV